MIIYCQGALQTQCLTPFLLYNVYAVAFDLLNVAMPHVHEFTLLRFNMSDLCIKMSQKEQAFFKKIYVVELCTCIVSHLSNNVQTHKYFGYSTFSQGKCLIHLVGYSFQEGV